MAEEHEVPVAEIAEAEAEELEAFPREELGVVTWHTWFWIFLMAFWVIGTGLFLYFMMGNNYVTIPGGNWPLR
jgi:hypothetical protein